MGKERVVEVTQDIVDKIEVLRFKADSKNGFQRELHHGRASVIARAAKEGTFIPPIFVAELPDKRLILIDGQHRLQAYKLSKFPLKAIVFSEKTVKDAASQFIDTNTHAVRVSLGFRLNVDPGPDARWMRDLAAKYETNPRVIYNTVVGIVGKHHFNSGGRRVNKHGRELAERIFEDWCSDKRWNDRAYVYSSIAVLKMVGTLAGESTNPHEVIKFMKGLDWERRSRLGSVTGSSWVFQDKMRRAIERTMRRSGKGHLLAVGDPKKIASNAKQSATRRTA